jgi:hypothetical protein
MTIISNTKLLYIFYFFCVYPVIEWSIHYYLHVFNERKHKSHHLLFHNNNVRIEKWPTLFIMFGIYFRIYVMVASFMYYFVIHTCTHKYPELFPELTKHHEIHHRNPNHNFCVCAKWPDKLFKTYKAIEQS